MRKLLNEEFMFTSERPGFIGYFLNRDGRERWVTNNEAQKTNTIERMEELVREKGRAALFALKNKVMLRTERFNDDEARMEWAGRDSWYDEENFFFVTGFPGYEDKKVAFQIRISDHVLIPSIWYTTHVKRTMILNGKKIFQNAQFVLNLIIDRVNLRGNRAKMMHYEENDGITVINTDFDEDEKSPEQIQEITKFFKDLTSGNKPVISFEKIKELFGRNDGTYFDIAHYGRYYDDINFTDRDKIKRKDLHDIMFNKAVSNPEPLKDITVSELFDYMNKHNCDIVYLNDKRESVNPEDVTDEERKNLKRGKVFYYDTFPYICFEDDCSLYRIKNRDSKGNLFFNNLIPVNVIWEGKIKFSIDDISYMINECVKQLIKKRRLI